MSGKVNYKRGKKERKESAMAGESRNGKISLDFDFNENIFHTCLYINLSLNQNIGCSS